MSNKEAKLRVKKAIRAQASMAQVTAQVKAVGEMANELAKQMEEVKLDQSAALATPVDQSLPRTTRKKRKPKKTATVFSQAAKMVGIALILMLYFVNTQAAVTKKMSDKLCPDLKGEFKDELRATMLLAKTQDDVHFPSAPNVRETKLSDLMAHLAMLQNGLLEIRRCKGVVSNLLQTVMNEIQITNSPIVAIKSCKQEYVKVVQALNRQNFDQDLSELSDPTYTECSGLLIKVRAVLEKTLKYGHDAHHHKFGKEKKISQTHGCAKEKNWKNWGYLSNGNGEACTNGLSNDFDFNVKICKKDVHINVNGKAKDCRIGFRRFGGHGAGFYALPALDGDLSCSFGCFHKSEVYEAFTNQPLCVSCVSPFLDVLWDVTCFPDDLKTQPKAITSILIYKFHTDFLINNITYSCHNSWSFIDCCGGKGPSAGERNVLVDKYCVCAIGQNSDHVIVKVLDMIKHLMNEKVSLLFGVMLLLFGAVVSPGLTGIVVLSIIAYMVIGANALCHQDNIVAAEAVLDKTLSVDGYKASFKIQEGQCIGVGGGMLEITSISRRHLYRFDKSVPYKAKLTCANVDWGCWGGSESELASRNNSCSESCDSGIIYTYQEKVPAFSGSGCAAFWEGVLLRQDLCFSIGEFGSQCRFYRHISYEPAVVVSGLIYVHGSEKRERVDLTEGDKASKLTLESVSSHSDVVPTMLMKRGATELCSSVNVPLENKCGSINLLKPNDIQPECYGPRLEWNQIRNAHEIVFKPKDAEDIVHNYFERCRHSSNLTFDGDEAYFVQDSLMAIVTIVAQKVDFAPDHHWCVLGNLKVTSQAGTRGFRMSTHVEIEKSTDSPCKVMVRFAGCTALQSSLIVIAEKNKIGLEYYCHGNATDNLVLSTKSETKSFVVSEINRNWVPLTTSFTNTMTANVLKVEPRKMFGDMATWLGSLNLNGVMIKLFDFVSNNLLKYAAVAVLVVVAYNGLARGNLLNVTISMVAIYLILFTGQIMALDVNAAVVPAMFIKAVRANTIWFLNYNLVDCYVLADVLDLLFMVTAITILAFVFGVMLAVVVTLSIKFWVQYHDEMAFNDALVPIGRELRHLGVLDVCRLLPSRKEFSYHYDHDMYSHEDARYPYLRAADMLDEASRIYLGDEEMIKVSMTEVSLKIRCKEHCDQGINNVAIGGGYFSYEWRGDDLCVYLCEHVVEVDKRLFRRVYGDVYACTTRQVHKDVITFTTPKGEAVNGLIKGVLSEELRGISGYTCVTQDGDFYVVHAAQNVAGGAMLCAVKRCAQPSRLGQPPYSCRVCRGNASNSDDVAVDPVTPRISAPTQEMDLSKGENDSDVGVECSGRRRSSSKDRNRTSAAGQLEGTAVPSTSSAGQPATEVPIVEIRYDGQIIRERVPPLLRAPIINVYIDAWGIRYDRLTEDGRIGLRCTEIELWTTHVDVEQGVQILPDVSTMGQSFRPYAPTDSYCWVYTDVGNSKSMFYIQPKRQFFCMMEGSKVYVIIAPVIKSKTKLTSGQIFYLWRKGFYPCKENFKAVAPVTIARKVGGYYYYPLINDSCTIAEIKIRHSDNLGYIENTPYVKERKMSQVVSVANYYETHDFGKYKMLRFLTSSHQVLHTYEIAFEENYEPFEWSHQFDEVGDSMSDCLPDDLLLVAGHRTVFGVGNLFTNELDKHINFNEFIKEVIRGKAVPMNPVKIPILLVHEESKLNDRLRICVNVRRSDIDNVQYTGGKINIYATASGLVEQVKATMNNIWRSGVEVVAVSGDVADIISNYVIAPYDFFVGCETRETPTLIYLTKNENETKDVKDWLEAELTDEHRRAIVDYNQISIHPDWHWESQALVPSSKHSVTQRSLAEWRGHSSFPVEEVEFRPGDWLRMTSTDVPSLLEIGQDDYWIGELQSFTSRGSCVGLGNELMTNAHVTRGAPINVYRNGYDYKWDKPFYHNLQEDVCVYGSKLIDTYKAEIGEILCTVCPLRRISQFLIVTKSNAEFLGRAGAQFYDLRPVSIDTHFTKAIPVSWRGVCGMSGCPIFNSMGRLISVYGLGKVETRILGVAGVGFGENIRALTVMAPTVRPEIVPDAFFRAAANEAVNTKYTAPSSYFLCSAPTGTGKTIYFTKSLMECSRANSKILLLQPTVAAVVGAFERLSSLMDVSGSNNGAYTVRYVIGQRHESNSRSLGNGSKILTLMTYGRALLELNAIESSYDYVLLDEIHNLNDATVLACDLRLTKLNAKYKCIHLSATIKAMDRAHKLVPHMDIGETRFKIDETVKIQPMISANEDGFVNIPSKIIGIKIDGFSKGYKIPMNILASGRVIFFVSSKRDCENLANYFYRSVGGNRQYLPVHSGTTMDINSLQDDSWLICTDIVGQSITVPGCKAVVDFLEEIKPYTRMVHNSEGVLYSRSLRRRRIDAFVSKQRRGRTGRTNSGWYITPVGTGPVVDNGVDCGTIAEAMLKLRATVGFSNIDIRDYYVPEVLALVSGLSWILPDQIVELPEWNSAVNGLNVNRRYSVSANMADKLKLVHNVSGDIVYLYLTLIISRQLVDKTMANRDLSRTGSEAGDREFYLQLSNYVRETKTEELRTDEMRSIGFVVESDRESLSVSKDLSYEMYGHVKYSNVLVEEVPDDEYIEDSAVSLMMSAASACTALTGIYWWLEFKASRRVTRAVSLSGDQVVPACKYYAQKTTQNTAYEGQRRTVAFLLRDNVHSAIEWMTGLGINKEKLDAESLINQVLSYVDGAFALVPAAWHIGLVPSLVALCGASMVGSWYVSIEEVLGATLSVGFLMAINAGVACLMPVPSLITFAVAEIITFTVSGIINRKSVLYDRLGRSLSYPSKAWRLMFGAVGGCVLGRTLIAPLLVSKPVIAMMVGQRSATSPGVNLGRAGNAIMLIKQLYVALVRVGRGQADVNILAPVLSAISLSATMDMTTISVGVIVVVGLIVVRKGLEYAKFQAGSAAKGVRSADGRNPYIEDYFGDFDDTALTILGTASIFANPTSAISILISWISSGIRQGQLTGQSFKDSFEVYAGVPLAITVITEGLKWISSWSAAGEVNHSSLLFTLPSAIAGLFGCIYYGGQPKVRDTVYLAWQYMSQSVMGVVKAISELLLKVSTRTIRWIGRQMGDGVMQSLPKWIRPTSEYTNDRIELFEHLQVDQPEPLEINRAMYHQWKRNGGLTTIERLYFSLKIGVKERSGSVPPDKYISYAKSNPGISFVWRGRSSLPYEMSKLTTEDLNTLTRQFSVETEMTAGVMKMSRGSIEMIVEASYNQLASTVWFEVSSSISSFGLLMVAYPGDGETTLTIIGYNISSSLARGVVGQLSVTHPLIKDMAGANDCTDLLALEAELDTYLSLTQKGVSLERPSLGSRVLLGAANLYVSVSRNFFADVLTMKVGLNGTPDEWLEKPDLISEEDWSVVCYYVLGLYEAGARTGPFRVPNRSTDLPLQLYANTLVQWRRLELEPKELRSERFSVEMPLENRKSVRMRRRTFGAKSNLEAMLEGTDCAITMDTQLKFKNQWLHAAYWTGSFVMYIHAGQVYACTVGGNCECCIVIDTDESTLCYRGCGSHEISMSNIEKTPSWSAYLSRGKEMNVRLAMDINSVLDDWSATNGRVKRKSGPKVSPDWLGRGFVENITDRWTRTEVEHSVGLFSDLLDSFKETLRRRPTTVSEIMVGALDQLNEASMEVQEVEDDDVQTFEDAVGSRDEFLLGWDIPNVRIRPRWSWMKQVTNMRTTEIKYRDIENVSIKNNVLGARLDGKTWESLKERGRVHLPKRVGQDGLYVSRGGLKMQQLWEADPDFWEDARVFMDPTGGYGGFAEFLGMKFKHSKSRQYIISTLHEKGHRIPDPRITTMDSNLLVQRATNHEHLDKGNIKDVQCRNRLKNISNAFGGVDVLILDAGEYSANLKTNRDFWMRTIRGDTFLEAVVDLQDTINPGGKMCVKINGVWEGLYDVIFDLTKHFKEIKAIKLGTTSNGSPEFYLFMRGYNKNRKAPALRTHNLLSALMEQTFDGYMSMRRTLIHKGRGMKATHRYDWFEPVEKSGVVRLLEDTQGRPEPIEIEVDGKKHKWEPMWDERIEEFIKLVKSRNLRWLPQSKIGFKNVVPIGMIGRKKTSHPSKNVENGLISGFAGEVFSLNLTNSTFCHTQSSDRWKEASALKRLDVNPGHMDQGSFAKLIRAMELTDSSFGRSLKGQCGLMSKEDVLKAINYQGSTGVLDNGHTLREFIDKNQMWYEECMVQISRWAKGRSGGTYFTCRPKNEPKKKKNVDDGRLKATKGDYEELESYNEQGHRFIQFADARSRLSHYILLGDLLSKANKCKIYKGTINGTPVMRQGAVLRRLWDRHKLSGGEITDDNQHRFGVEYVGSSKQGTEVAGICLDYSGWDVSVTPEERLLEAVWLSSFYPEDVKPAIMQACMEMGYPIVTNDDGDCWVRGGQRGSGELLTSIGNTKLVVCNTLVAISEALGISLEQLTETSGTLKYLTLEGAGDAGVKEIELMMLSQLSDGDDTVIFGPDTMIRSIVNGIEEPLNRLKKVVRSGITSGVKHVTDFKDVEFCSHSYSLVLVGANNKPVRKDELDSRLRGDPTLRCWYLPTRPISDVLSKMRLTLKINTQKWNREDETCVTITRSKVMSYLLLYPHLRPVRHSCIMLLSVIGEGAIDSRTLTYRLGTQMEENTSCKRALMSIYGVELLTEIGYRHYGLDHKDLQTLRYNIALTNQRCRISQQEYIPRMIRWAINQGMVDQSVIRWDERLSDFFFETNVVRKRMREDE